MSYHKRCRVYKSGKKKSEIMNEVLPHTITLRKDVLPFFARKQLGNSKTVFREINIVSPNRVWGKGTKSLMNSTIDATQIPFPKFAKIIMRAMKSAIVDKWESSKFHIVQHSGGYDSRMISIALSQLKNERGNSWLGDILFVEGAGEQVPFRQIMKAQGWKPKQYTVYNPTRTPRKKQERSFRFKDAWKKLNGYCGYPVNINYDMFEWLNEYGYIPDSEDCQILTGYGANEIGNWVKFRGGFKRYAEFIYYHALSSFPLWGGEDAWIHPFYHIPYIRTWIKYCSGQSANYRKPVTNAIMPKLKNIIPISKRKKTKLGYRSITKGLLEQCICDYQESWFAKVVNPPITHKTTINYLPWWGYWSLASFCEHLIQKGHIINVS